MNAIETLNAYCEAQGYSPLEILDCSSKFSMSQNLEGRGQQSQMANDPSGDRGVSGVLYRYGAEATEDETPSERMEFGPVPSDC